jgi:riboflavin transporter FmnP
MFDPRNGDFFMKKLTLKEIVLGGSLASLSAVTQLIHIGYRSPQWGMWLDIVAVSWLMAFFLYGFRLSLIVSIIGSLIITLFAPETWLGASMKFTATIPLILSLVAYQKITRSNLSDFSNPKHIVTPLIIGIIIRSVIIIPVNYYYAIPIWTGMQPAQAMSVIPWYVIFIFNTVQSVIDVMISHLLVFKFKLDRFSHE